ncbi:MAG: L,D-transpeptidase, partial [Mesorhizobium sp.]
MQLRSFILAGLWAVLSLGAPAYAAMPAGNSAPKSAVTTDVVNVAAKSDAAQLRLLKKKKDPSAADLAQIRK